MDAKGIINEIEKLSVKEKAEVFSYIEEKISLEKKKYALSVLEKLKGRGKNILNLEGQEYINTLRTDGRI
jgi:hypothetical protein